jgi:hypothetical protein
MILSASRAKSVHVASNDKVVAIKSESVLKAMVVA